MKKIKDHYFLKAKREGYVARSAYKLEEIDKKHRLLRNGNLVLDLGCSPGSWLQYSSGKIGKRGLVRGIDIDEVKILLPANVNFIRTDIFEINVKDLKISGKMFDVILSDMSPKTTGIRSVDAHRSYALNQHVLKIAEEILKPGGNLLVKAFQGENLNQLRTEFKKLFMEIKFFKPKSSRSESVEIFLLGQIKKC